MTLKQDKKKSKTVTGEPKAMKPMYPLNYAGRHWVVRSLVYSDGSPAPERHGSWEWNQRERGWDGPGYGTKFKSLAAAWGACNAARLNEPDAPCGVFMVQMWADERPVEMGK